MQINNQDLLEWIIKPTLQTLDCPQVIAAQNLLLAIANQKANPKHLQRGLGIYHIDSLTHQRVWDKYLAFHPDLASKIRGLASQRAFLINPHLELTTNLRYATAIAWIIYIAHPIELRVAEAIA
jgi:hypothetical protein